MKLYTVPELLDEREALTRLMNHALSSSLEDNHPMGSVDPSVVQRQLDMVEYLLEGKAA